MVMYSNNNYPFEMDKAVESPSKLIDDEANKLVDEFTADQSDEEILQSNGPLEEEDKTPYETMHRRNSSPILDQSNNMSVLSPRKSFSKLEDGLDEDFPKFPTAEDYLNSKSTEYLQLPTKYFLDRFTQTIEDLEKTNKKISFTEDDKIMDKICNLFQCLSKGNQTNLLKSWILEHISQTLTDKLSTDPSNALSALIDATKIQEKKPTPTPSIKRSRSTISRKQDISSEATENSKSLFTSVPMASPRPRLRSLVKKPEIVKPDPKKSTEFVKFMNVLDSSDELIKGHLNMLDRRLKSASIKSSCHIEINGPHIEHNYLSPNKRATYNCTIRGKDREHISKCITLLNDYYPTTSLRLTRPLNWRENL